MLEDQVASLLQRYLGNYVRGLNKEALNISVWRGDVELTNMQLKPEALNALKLPVKVKAGFLGSIRLKVPWSRLGQEPVLVYLDRILILAEPETQVEGFSEETIQEAKRSRVREMEMRLLDAQQHLKSEINTSWLGSLINTIIGNLKLSITNIHIRYEDLESNPGHPFAAGLTLGRLSAMTVDDAGKEAFATGGALEHIQKSVELECLAFYLDSDVSPWNISKQWEDLYPSEWSQIFEIEKHRSSSASVLKEHCYILQPVTGNARYTKIRLEECRNVGQPLQKASINLEDVTLCLSQDGYKDILRLADNFAAFNQRLKYAHYRPQVPIKADSRSWWKYAYKVVTDEMKAASGMLSWEQVLRHARLRKKYISLYASLLKSDASQMVADDNEEIKKLDRELDIDVILQWRMLAHKFVQQSMESDDYQNKQRTSQSWWTFGWTGSSKEGEEFKGFTEEDWERLNKYIGYKEGIEQTLITQEKADLFHLLLEVHMKHNASKLISRDREHLADLSCDGLDCAVKIYSESKVFDLKLGSYRLSSPSGLLAESATIADSLVGIFSYKPFESELDWSFVAKASPCYMTYLKDSIDHIISFFRSSSAISQTLALETAAAVQMTLDGVKRTAQKQVSRALKDHARFLLDLDIAAPKITIPTEFCPDNVHATKLLLDLGNLKLSTQDKNDLYSDGKRDLNLQFNVVLNDVSAFLVDGEYSWRIPHTHMPSSSGKLNYNSLLPVIDKCAIVLKLQQIQSENPFYQSTEVAVRLPAFGFHFSPARYHRLMKVLKLFQDDQSDTTDFICPWNQADFEGWLSVLSWKGVGNREAVWQHRYVCIVGAFLYILKNPSSKTYKQYFSLRGKQVHHLPLEFTGDQEHVLAVCDSSQLNNKVVEDVNALILRCDTDESRRTWQNRLQGAIYRASGPAAVSGLSDVSSTLGTTKAKQVDSGNIASISSMEKLFVTGVLDELKICFSCNYHSNQNFNMLLLGKESGLFELRASGGQVELSVRQNDLFIGTILKSLEVEDLFCFKGMTKPRYLARSFIKSKNDTALNSSLFFSDGGDHKFSSSDQSQLDGEESFFEASDKLSDFVEPAFQPQEDACTDSSYMVSFPSSSSSISAPSFNRVPGLLPDSKSKNSMDLEKSKTLDSFVKAQIIIFDQDSPLYNSMDKQVILCLATLSFFCHRPTVLAIMEFVNAINAEDDDKEMFLDTASADEANSSGDVLDQSKSGLSQEPVIKGLLGRGKSRVLFCLSLNMATAQIFLMNENGTCLTTLSQNNLRTEIKVFPSSFNVKASLGNLKINDDSLPLEHPYFWVCDMRNPVGSSFVELEFSSFSVDDEDYEGFEYSLNGQLSEVRIIYLNRFVQEVVSYFMGLAPSNSKGLVKLKDQVTDSEKWFTSSEIEGSPAVKLDLSLTKPIILMPRRTNSLDYLELDVLEIAVYNTFQWFGGDKNEINAVHIEMMTVKVKDINLTIGTGTITGESIIQDVKGLSIVVQRSLRDLLHQVPSMEATIKVEELTAALSNREYQIITECTLSNFSETPHFVPPLDIDFGSSADKEAESMVLPASEAAEETMEREAWITMKISVTLTLLKLSLYSGSARDSCLATVQAKGAWLLYKSNSLGQGFLSATLKHFTVIDDRESTKKEFRLAVGEHESLQSGLQYDVKVGYKSSLMERKAVKESDFGSVPTMLIIDVKFKQASTTVSLCIQRPHLLVALDFLLAVVEFFVPTIRSTLSDKRDDDPIHVFDAITLDQSIYSQPLSEFSLSPKKPLIVDSERVDHFIYDGKGGTLCLQDRHGVRLSNHSAEAIIFIGNGKRLQFRNVNIKNGEFLDSCIYLGTNSSYSASEDDNVFLEKESEDLSLQTPQQRTIKTDDSKGLVDRPSEVEYVIELQAIGPELTFYSTSRDVGDSLIMSTKLLHAQFDMLCRLVMKADTIDLSGNVLGLKLESNGIRVLEPFDTCVNFSNVSGKTKINASISDIYMNFSFSILKLFLAIEEDILEFLRMTTNKVSVVCSQFDRVGTIQNHQSGQTYAFWRPRAPPGFAVLGDCLTPLNEPPSKGVTAVNTNFARVKRPISFKLIWPCLAIEDLQVLQNEVGRNNCPRSTSSDTDKSRKESSCSVWFPVAPQGYVAVGCVVSTGRDEPPLSSALCLSSSLVSCCSLQDCISLCLSEPHPISIALWRVDNSFGSFLPTEPYSMNLMGKAYELRHLCFTYSESTNKSSVGSSNSQLQEGPEQIPRSESSTLLTSSRLFKPIASFRLIWWNQGAQPNKRLSIWRPVVPQGMAYLGDIAVQGYEPPNTCVVLHDTEDEALLKPAINFQLVGYIKKQKGIESISFWLPQAPPGFVSLGCIASKSSPKPIDFSSLRCVRSDLVTGSVFPEESIWNSSDTRTAEWFSIWTVDNEACTFFARKGLKRPPKRFALRLADPRASSGSDDTIIDLEMKTFSAAVYDDYAGLMVPLFNISFSKVGFNIRGGLGYLNSTVSFSLAARSYNDKLDSWEPLIEPIDGFVRYEYDLRAPGAISQLRIATTRDLNLIISVSNMNMIIQAYSSWNSLNNVSNSDADRAIISPTYEGGSVIDAHHRRNYYIIPQNKLGQDIYIRVAENKRFSDIIKMPSGDNKCVTVPVSKNLMDSHFKGKHNKVSRSLVSIIIADAELPAVEAIITDQYITAVRIFPRVPNGSSLQQQSARTCGAVSEHCSSSRMGALVVWNETFFFKVEHVDGYMVEFTVINVGTDEPVGVFSAPLKTISLMSHPNSSSCHPTTNFQWQELFPVNMMDSHSDTGLKSSGRIRFSILLTDRAKMENNKLRSGSGKTRGFIQISPAKEGPWTTVRLNYAAPAACWRFGNNVIVSEVNVLDSSRYVNIRSLVSLVNKTGFLMEFSLKSKPSVERIGPTDEREEEEQSAAHSDICETEELFQIEKHVSSIGWVGCSTQMPFYYESNGGFAEVNSQEMSTIMLPDGWEWTDDWHVDTSSVNSDDGWVYAPGPEHLKWPDSFSPANSPMHARQRRWIRHRKYIPAGLQNCMSLGQVKPGEAVPLPLQCLIHPTLSYYLQLRPTGSSDLTQYSWSKALSNFDNIENSTPEDFSDVCVSSLGESEELLFCEPSGNSSDGLQSLWFRLSIKALDIGKDIHSDPIHDWNLVIDSPLSFTYFLPITADYSVLRKEPNGHFVTCSRGRFNPGETVEVYDVDLREGLYLSLVPQGGWEPLHEPALISHPSRKPSKTMSLRSCFSGRIVQVILEQNHEGNQMQSRLIRIYVPYWISSTRCPPLIYRIVDVSERRERTRFAFRSRQQDEKVILQITQDEMLEGDTISAALNFKHLGMSLSLGRPGKENFGPVKELLPLGDMDGSMDLYAYDTEGNCIRVLISSKPCRYQAVPTKVISVRPFMTFTNRIGQDIFIKFGDEDQQKVLHPSDSRVSFVYSGTEGSERLQVRMEDTNWSYPVEILKEDKITLMLRDSNGERKFLRLEIRGYEEGSRFLIVLRPGSAHGPIRVENRIANMKINIRQSSLGDDAWIPIHPLSSINFSWEVPYGPNLLDICIKNGHTIYAQNISLEKATESCANLNTQGFELHVLEVGDVKIARVTDIKKGIKQQSEEQHRMLPISNRENLSIREEMGNTAAPMELIVELSVVSVSLVDHRPRELLYLYLEKVFISYASGYDGGTTSRFKLIMGQLQLDNQLPLTVMPVLLMPERMGDTCHPVFKTTITMSNENIDGIQVYPYVYVRVTENYWRINIHEPIIWALIDFYNNLHIDHVPNTSSVTQVDPEIRIDLIDVSEIRLKVSLETAPSQRPHGVLGIWSPILSAVGNALKIQVRLRKVMHRSRFMRKSFIIPAIMNRIKRDLIHNPLHIILSVDVLGMTKSTFASLSKGFAELSTDVQFLQLRSKQVWSRRITGVSDGILQGTEALAQGVAFGVSGVITKPVESARERGVLGLPHGVGRAIIGFIVQPVSGALDFVSLTVDGIGASCARCLELLSNKSAPQRIRNPRVVHANGLLKEYSEREATGQMILYLAEASRHLGCTNLFKEPSKYAWSDCYEDYFILPYQRILLITNKRVMLLLCLAPDKMDRKPSKIIWDVPWEEIMALELAKAGYPKPSHLIIHLKSFKKSESFVRLVKCSVEEEDDQEPQAVRICLVVRQTWKSHQLDMKSVTLRVPERQRYVQFAWDETDGGDSDVRSKPIIRPRELTSSGATPGRFAMHSVNFQKIWSSERDSSSRCTFCPKQVVDDNVICSIWRPVCPDGYVPVGDVARVGIHPPNVAAVYRHSDRKFTHPVGYDLVWRNCIEDYVTPVSIWSPRPPEGFISLGCVAVAGFEEPHPDTVYCVSTNIAGEALFEDQVMWTAPDSYPWACFIYQVQSEALHFVAMRQPKEDSNWKPMRVLEHEPEESQKNQR